MPRKITFGTLLAMALAGLIAVRLELLPQAWQPVMAAAYPYLVLGLGALAALSLFGLAWEYLGRPTWHRGKRVLSRRRERGLQLRETAAEVEEALKAAKKEQAAADRRRGASQIRDPWGGAVLWKYIPSDGGGHVEFWSDDHPKFVSLGFRFPVNLRDCELSIGEELQRPGLHNDKAKVIVRFNKPLLEPGKIAVLRLLSENGQTIREGPNVAEWHY